MTRMIFHRSVTLILLLFIYGCGLTGNWLDLEDQAGFDQYIAEGNKKRLEVEPYIGRTRAEVEKKFGKPTKIFYKSWYLKRQYEEEWYYKYDLEFFLISTNEHTFNFFFNDGIVQAINCL